MVNGSKPADYKENYISSQPPHIIRRNQFQINHSSRWEQQNPGGSGNTTEGCLNDIGGSQDFLKTLRTIAMVENTDLLDFTKIKSLYSSKTLLKEWSRVGGGWGAQVIMSGS